MNPPRHRQNTITKYSICESSMAGEVHEKRENYDLMTIIMMCLGNSGDTESDILKLLDVLFSEESAEDKKRILEKEFHIKMTKKLEREMMQMCNYSNGVLERGIERGMERGIEQGIKTALEDSIRNLMNSMNWTEEQAMEALQIPKQQREQYRKNRKVAL